MDTNQTTANHWAAPSAPDQLAKATDGLAFVGGVLVSLETSVKDGDMVVITSLRGGRSYGKQFVATAKLA